MEVELAHPSRRRVWRHVGVAAALVAAVVGAYLATRDTDSARPLAMSGAPVPTVVDDTTTTTTTTTTADRTPTTVRATAATPGRAVSAAAPAMETPTGAGKVLTVDLPGIWAIDVQTRTMRRIADPAPFDVSGNDILFGRGRTVYAQSINGGGPTPLYELPHLTGGHTYAGGAWVDKEKEEINLIEAAPDHTAFIGVRSPMYGGDGNLTGSEGMRRLVSPTGQVGPDMFGEAEVEWTDDGSLLIAQDYQGLRAIRRNHTIAWGPVATPHPYLDSMRITPDGLGIAGESDGGRIYYFHRDTDQWDVLSSVCSFFDIGPTGVFIGLRCVEGGYFVSPGILTWNPATGATTSFSKVGSDIDWSPDGRHTWILDPTPARDDDQYTIRVTDASGAPVLTVNRSTDSMAFARAVHLPSSNDEPQWSADGRYLVVAVFMGSQTPQLG